MMSVVSLAPKRATKMMPEHNAVRVGMNWWIAIEVMKISRPDQDRCCWMPLGGQFNVQEVEGRQELRWATLRGVPVTAFLEQLSKPKEASRTRRGEWHHGKTSTGWKVSLVGDMAQPVWETHSSVERHLFINIHLHALNNQSCLLSSAATVKAQCDGRAMRKLGLCTCRLPAAE